MKYIILLIYVYIYVSVCVFVCVCWAFVGLDNKIVNIYLLYDNFLTNNCTIY
jgi:hypothetical protein